MVENTEKKENERREKMGEMNAAAARRRRSDLETRGVNGGSVKKCDGIESLAASMAWRKS